MLLSPMQFAQAENEEWVAPTESERDSLIGFIAIYRTLSTTEKDNGPEGGWATDTEVVLEGAQRKW